MESRSSSARPATSLSQPIPAGDALRVRVHYLVAQHQAIVVQTQFSDAKAAALLTLSGIAAIRAPIPATPDLMQISLAALLFLTVMLCLLAVIPRYRARGRDQADQFTWLALTDWRQESAYAEFVKTTDFSDLITSLA